MTKDTTNDALAHLRELVDKKEMEIFSKKEVETIRAMIQFYDSFVAFGRVGIWLRNLALFIGSVVLVWASFQNWIVDFIRGAAK